MAFYVRLLRNFPEWNYQISFVKKTKTTTTPKIQIWYLLVPKWADLIARLDYKNNRQSTINHHQQPTTKKNKPPISSSIKIFLFNQKQSKKREVTNVRGFRRLWAHSFISSKVRARCCASLAACKPSSPARSAKPAWPTSWVICHEPIFDRIHGTGILW